MIVSMDLTRLRIFVSVAELDPGLTLTTTGHVAPGNGDGSTPRTPYGGVMFNPALRSSIVRDNGTLQLQSNFHQDQALQFGARGNGAPKFDLSDYLVRAQTGPLTGSLGHLSYGANKHLISGFASRGVSVAVALSKVAELSFAALNGTSVVGWSNPLGMEDASHRMIGASLKVEAVPNRPGAASSLRPESQRDAP